MNLKRFENNIKSQFGEDGVIKEIFERIGTQNEICVEFGAWDGIHYSNTWNLWHNLNWTSYLIEGDTEKVKILKENTFSFPKVTAINKYVMPEGKDSLDNILSQYQIPQNFDLLSIDIDSDDYYVLENLTKYSPRLILIEYNPTIPLYLDVVQKPGEYFGCSALALFNLATKLKYKLAHMTDSNMILVREDDFPRLNIKVDLQKIFPVKYLTNVITSYDGRALLTQLPIYMGDLKINEVKKEKRIDKSKKTLDSSNNLINFISKTELIQVSIFKKEG